MGEYTIPGFLSGRDYRFTIAGDQPSATEMQRMQGILQRDELTYKQQFESGTGVQIPYDPEAGTAFGRGLERGIPQFQSALGSAAGAAGLEGVSDYLKTAAQDRERSMLVRDPSLMESADFRDVRGLSSALSYAGELLGEQAPLIGGTVGATGAGMLAGASAPVAAGLGTLLVSYPQLFGSNIQRQEGQVAAGELAGVDVPKAALTAIGQTALEAASNVLLVGQAGKGLGRALLTNIPAEAATEVGQQVLERKQAGLDLDSEDAYREYLDAGVAGGTLGGIFGAAGSVGGRRATPEDPLLLPPPETTEQFDDDPIGQRPGPEAGNATVVGTTRITSGKLNETRVNLSDGSRLIIPGNATQTEVDTAVNEYRASAQGRTPPTGAAPATETTDAISDTALPDPTQPITTRTLDALGVPTAARSYRKFKSGVLSRDEAIENLQSFADAAVADGRPELQPATRRTLQFIDTIRGLDRAPLSEAEAFEQAAAEASAKREAEAAEARAAAFDAAVAAEPSEAEPDVQADTVAKRKPKPVSPAAAADVAKGVAQTEMDLGPVVDPDAVVEEVVEPTLDIASEIAAPATAPQAEVDLGDTPADTITQPTLPPAVTEDVAPEAPVIPPVQPEQVPALEVTQAPREPMTGAIPGAPLGTAGQNIPVPIAPAPAPTVAPTPRATPQVPEDVAENRALENRIAERFIATASRELEAHTRYVAPYTETMPTTAKDKTAVLGLLEDPPAKPKGEKTTDRYAAYSYFKNYPDVGTAIHAIVSDFVAVGSGGVPKLRTAKHIMAGESKMTPQLKVDLEVYKDTGTEPAKRAVAWMRKNMSPETIAAMRDLAATYRPRDYEAQAEKADARKARRAEQREAEKGYRESIVEPGETAYEADVADELGLSQEDSDYIDTLTADFRAKTTNGAPLHPRVVEYLRAGDLLGALRNLRITSANKYMAKLADKMGSMIPDVRVGLVSEADMARIEAVVRPGRTPDPRGVAMGVYVPRLTPEALADLRRQGRDETVDFAEQYGGSILLNETSGLDTTTLLHEVSHAVLDRVTRNPSHPLTRQLMTLMSKVTPHTPPGFNGAENLQEFVAEGLTDSAFRRELSLLNPDGEKFSAWEMFTHRIKNFFRKMIGAEPRPIGSAADVIDRALDTVLAAKEADRGAGDIMGSSFRPQGARSVLGKFKDRVKVPTAEDMREVQAQLRSERIPTRYKEGMVWLTMNLDYVADAATRYFPNTARTIHDLVNQHRTKKQAILDLVTESLVPVNEWVVSNIEKIDTFNDVRFTATRFGADPRKARSEYEGFSYKYDRIDPVSGDVVTDTSSRFKTQGDLNAAMQQHNQAGIPGHSEAEVDFTEDADQLAAYDEIMPKYRSLGPAGRKAMDALFVIPEVLTKNLASALKTRLEALLPGNRALQERIYGKIYDKVFNGKGVTPYQALSRTGDYALSYYGADPKKVQLDENGDFVGSEPDVEYMTHSFQTARQRDAAIRLLKAQPAGFRVDHSTITPYQQADPRKRSKMPEDMAARLLSAIDAAGLDSTVRDSVLEMVLDTAPETSFMQMFRTRKGTRGFVGDITPLQQGLDAGDTIANIRDNSLRLAGNIVDIEFGAKFAKAKQELNKELQLFNVGKQAKDVEEAQLYYDALMSYTTSVFRRQGETAQLLNTMAYGLTLGGNVSSALVTFSSVPVYVYPFLAGKHGGKAAMQAIGHATRMLAGTGVTRTAERITSTGTIEGFRKKGKFFEISVDNLDLSDPSNPKAYLRAFQNAARINGLVGRSLTQDLTAGEQVTGRMALFKKVVAVSGVMQSTAERLTREMTGIAKYHLALRDIAKANNMGDFSIKQITKKLEDGSLRFTDAQYDAAAQDAMNVAEKTNGPMFSAASTQGAQSDLGSVLYLYKKHSLAMYNLLYQTLMRSVPSKEDIANMNADDRADALEDRRVARMQLGGMLGMLAVTSGALGMPLAQQIGWLYDAFADEDEEDFKTVLRTTIGEGGAYGLLDYLTGLRVSERIGLGAPFYRAGLNSTDTPLGWQIIEGIGGPVVGLGAKYVDRAIPLLLEGDIQRGTEAMMPSAIANMFRAARYAQEGVLTRRGDPIIDDISPASILAQAIGFMPAAYSRQLDQNAALSRIDNAIRTERSDLLSKRYLAVRLGDRVTFRDVEAQIAEFNRRNPGKSQITTKTKKASLAANMKTTSRMHHGVNLSQQNITRLMELADMYGPATVWQ